MQVNGKVFLRNGQAAVLKYETGGKFIVAELWLGYEGEKEVEFESDHLTSVEEIFSSPPIAVFENELKNIATQKKAAEDELRQIKTELAQLKRKMEEAKRIEISNEKFIIDRTALINAKSIAFFEHGKTMPVTIKGEKSNVSRDLSVTIEVLISSGEERAWGCVLAKEYEFSNRLICKEYGILIDPTQEEIEAATKARLLKLKFSDYEISVTPDAYLAEEQLSIKKEYLKKKVENRIESLKESIQKANDEIAALTRE